MDAQKLEQIQKVFANDRFATDNGAVIEQVDEGYAKCWLEIQPHHLNAAGTVMGGAIFTLADFAFADVYKRQITGGAEDDESDDESRL